MPRARGLIGLCLHRQIRRQGLPACRMPCRLPVVGVGTAVAEHGLTAVVFVADSQLGGGRYSVAANATHMGERRSKMEIRPGRKLTAVARMAVSAPSVVFDYRPG